MRGLEFFRGRRIWRMSWYNMPDGRFPLAGIHITTGVVRRKGGGVNKACDWGFRGRDGVWGKNRIQKGNPVGAQPPPEPIARS